MKLTVPKLQNETSEPPDSKPSTIHSAFCWQRGYEGEERCFDTLCPFDMFSMKAIPSVVEEAVTVSLMVSPALMLIAFPKEREYSGNLPYQALVFAVEGDTSPENGAPASRAINSYPSHRRPIRAAESGDSESPNDLVEGALEARFRVLC